MPATSRRGSRVAGVAVAMVSTSALPSASATSALSVARACAADASTVASRPEGEPFSARDFADRASRARHLPPDENGECADDDHERASVRRM